MLYVTDSIVTPDVVIQQASPILVSEDDTLQLLCSYWAVPSPDTISWSHDDKPTNDPHIMIESYNATLSLTITSVGKNNAGYYMCIVSNKVGTNTARVGVIFQCKYSYIVMTTVTMDFSSTIDIRITGPAPDDVITSGSKVILQCHLFRATGPLTYNWTREYGLTLPMNSFLDNNGE